ncbi:MAG: UDP-N-acetylmuramoyl-tripeptide--D-alanyl-D-alanine ligase [Clostridia bacterium]|nr:UDP-N-acetylmuramoyl-tripeptide--D-alanyl-D-alanine ligase [Clostridia bacterium]
MRKTSIKEILTATGGTLVTGSENNYITGIKHDSREIKPGDMFVAITGENQDGHKYIPQAIEDGVAAVLVSHTDGWPGKIPEGYELDIILVEDVIQAMGDLARWYISELGIKKVAVTGSVGKTSTRDMIYYVLNQRYNCGRNLKNYNNNIGLPVSIFQFDENTEAAVLEMGMDAFGEIDYLSGIVKPDIGVITNIGVAHMEKLGSREGIFKAKMEITANLAGAAEGGSLVFAQDDEFLTRERTAGDYEQVSVGYENSADYVISDVDDFGVEGIEFNVAHNDKIARVRLPLPGVHNATNAALAIAVGGLLGVDMNSAAEGLAGASLTGSRLKRIEGKTVTIIDDTYNANPDSMKSAIDVLTRSRAERKVAILGDMFELGDNTVSQHREVGEHAKEAGVDLVIAIGILAANIAEGANGEYFRNKEDFLAEIEKHIKSADMILVKASRGMKMEDIVDRLKDL